MSVFRKHGVEGEVTQQYECLSVGAYDSTKFRQCGYMKV